MNPGFRSDERFQGCSVGQFDTGYSYRSPRIKIAAEKWPIILEAPSQREKGVTHLFDRLKVELSENSMSKF